MLPGSGRFRAQAVGELLDSAFTLYRRNLRLILAITAAVQLPLAVFGYVAYQLTGVSRASSRLQQLAGSSGPLTSQQVSDAFSSVLPYVVVAGVIALVQGLVVQPIATAAMTRAVADIYLDEPTTMGSAYRAVGQRIGAVVGVSLLLFGAGVAFLAVTGALVVGVVLALGRGGEVLWLLIIPAAIFLGIVAYTRWLFAAPIVILERTGPVDALRRSWGLVRGSTPRIFGIMLLVGIITSILTAIVGSLLTLLTQVGDENLRLVLNQLASLIVTVLIQPISFIVVVLLYYDVRIRREAFDIEMLASTL